MGLSLPIAEHGVQSKSSSTRRGAVSLRFTIGLGVSLVFILYFILGPLPTGARKGQQDSNRLPHKVEDLVQEDGAILADPKQAGENNQETKFDSGNQRLVARQNPSSTMDICETQACKDYGAYIKRSLATNFASIDPCTDFWNFAVGNWQSFHEFRPDQSSVSPASVLGDSNTDLLRKILESPYNEATTLSDQDRLVDRDNFIKMKTVYDACMDLDLLKTIGVKPVKDLLDSLPKPDSGKYDTTNGLTDILIYLLKLGLIPLVNIGTGTDLKNPDVVTIYLNYGATGLPSKEYYKRTDVQADYTRTIAEMFDIFLGNTGTHGDIARQVFELERRFALAQPDPEQVRNVDFGYNPYRLEDVDKLVSGISLTQLVGAFTPPGYKADTVILRPVDYYRQLPQLIKSAPTDVLYAYFQWQLIASWSDTVHPDFRAPLRRFENRLGGRPDDAIRDRWRSCQKEVDDNIPWILSGAYVRARGFGQDSKSLGEQIIDDIKAVYEERFPTYDWMAKDVQERAKKKVSSMSREIGYPDKSPNVLDPRSVQEYYAGLTVSRTNYFENSFNMTYFNYIKSWDDLLRPTDKARWSASANTINAYYSAALNQIVFPAGIMQSPYFDQKLPEYVSYSGFGTVAGHESTHGFDDQGSKFDERGAFATWWDKQTRDNFMQRAKCFVQQYSKYSITGPDGKPLPLNGELTQGENIADAGGISTSYEAWKRRNDKKRNQMLPGLPAEGNWTPEKLFFVCFANAWVEKRRPQALIAQVLSDSHTPAEQRVLGMLANSKPFKEAFGCKDTKPVCELW